jgi:hypothetical protein
MKTAVKKWLCNIKTASIIQGYKLLFTAGPSTLKKTMIMWKTTEHYKCPCMLYANLGTYIINEYLQKTEGITFEATLLNAKLTIFCFRPYMPA